MHNGIILKASPVGGT